MSTIVDATVLSNFAAIRRIDLLQSVFGSAFLADAVHDEVQLGIAQGYDFLAAVEAQIASVRSEGWLRITTLETDEERSIRESLPARLHAGESMSLAIAAARGWTFFTDDAHARRVAIRLGVAVGGTLGILRRLVRSQMLTLAEGNVLLNRMITEAGYRSPVEDLHLIEDA